MHRSQRRNLFHSWPLFGLPSGRALSNKIAVKVPIHFGVTDVLGDLMIAGPFTQNAQTQVHTGIHRSRQTEPGTPS